MHHTGIEPMASDRHLCYHYTNGADASTRIIAIQHQFVTIPTMFHSTCKYEVVHVNR